MPPRAGPPYGSPHAAAPGPYSPPEQYPPPQGHPQNGGYTPQGYRPPGPDMRGLESGEQIAVFLGSLCISPIVAIVLYFVWKDDKPQKASEVCRLGWWVVGTWFALYALFFLIAILMA